MAPDVIERYGIEVVPLRVIFPDTTYRDRIDITPGEFYGKLATSAKLPTTSQPPASDFEAAFRRAAADGSEVLAVLLSADLSGTIASAVTAQRDLAGLPITVFDTKTISAPMAFMVERAAQRAASGATLQQILADLSVMRDRAQLLFVLETLEYLRKGGRIGGAAALAGSLLSIKPVLTIRDGKVDTWGKARGKRRALQAILEAARQLAGTGPSVRAAVVHSAVEGEAEEFRREVQRALDCPTPQLFQFSPVVGVHTGPGALGLGIYNEQWL
jgi:DegV family protein with EDD domain